MRPRLLAFCWTTRKNNCPTSFEYKIVSYLDYMVGLTIVFGLTWMSSRNWSSIKKISSDIEPSHEIWQSVIAITFDHFHFLIWVIMYNFHFLKKLILSINEISSDIEPSHEIRQSVKAITLLIRLWIFGQNKSNSLLIIKCIYMYHWWRFQSPQKCIWNFEWIWNYQTKADTNLIDIDNLHGENIYNCNGFVSTVLANNIIIDTKLTRAGS